MPLVVATSQSHVIDKGMMKIIHDMKIMDTHYTKVGLPDGKPVVKNGDSDISDMSDLASIGAYNEYGTHRIPARPFMATAFDENLPSLSKMSKELYNRVITGQMTVAQGLAIMGEKHKSDVQSKIREIKTPENAESTKKKKKGANNPLIDTGTMRSSITYAMAVRDA